MATTPEDAIRARRKLTNRLIAHHAAERLRPFFVRDATVIAGDGALIIGADGVISAFAAQFADPGFIAFVRETAAVELDAAGERAAESGRWTGAWRDHGMGGTYLAVWRKVTGQWIIESETFVTLSATPG